MQESDPQHAMIPDPGAIRILTHGARVGPSAAAIALGLVLLAAPAEAQRVTGRVIDDTTEQPVAGAAVTLYNHADSVIARVVTDSAGGFSVQGRRGVHRIRAQRIGYGPGSTAPLVLRDREDVTVVIRLSAAGLPLEPLEVRVRGGLERGRYGFERRRALGKGVFLTADSIDLRSPRVATDAFRAVEGVVIDWNPGGEPNIFTYSGAKCMVIYSDHIPLPFQTGQYRGIRGRVPRSLPRMALGGNGIFAAPEYREAAGGAGIDIAIDPRAMVAIEIYRDWAEVPRELKTADRMWDLWRGSEPCGLAIIWTFLAY